MANPHHHLHHHDSHFASPTSSLTDGQSVLLFDEATVASFRRRKNGTAPGVVPPYHHHTKSGTATRGATTTNTEQRKQQFRSLQKWSIPINSYVGGDAIMSSEDAPEIILLARIVWVKFQRRRKEPYLWPAIYYKSYKEIALHAPMIWSEMGFFRRLPLATTMVFDPSNPRNESAVARLLGRVDLELIEIPPSSNTNNSNTTPNPDANNNNNASLSEFYWELPRILPQVACNVEYFAQDPDLYFDWHRALDDVESIVRECLGNRYALTTEPSLKTWYQRAQDAERKRWNAAMKKEVLALASKCTSACATDYTCGVGGSGGGKRGGDEYDYEYDDDTLLADDDDDEEEEVTLLEDDGQSLLFATSIGEKSSHTSGM